MTSPIFWNGQLLFAPNGQLAMDLNCCCDRPSGNCCCNLSDNTLIATIAAPDCPHLDGVTITLTNQNDPTYCSFHVGVSATLDPCTTVQFTAIIRLRCNPTLSDRGGGLCDFYEASITYTSSACANTGADWRRVESGCSCSPLSLVFKLPPSSWSGLGGVNCDCCTSAADITVTITQAP